MSDERATGDDLVVKIVLAGVIAAVVGGVAGFSGLGIGWLLLAVVASVGGFWLLDTLMDSGATDTAAASAVSGPSAASASAAVTAPMERTAGPLPVTPSEPVVAPPAVEPPTIGEPAPPAEPEADEPVGARLDPDLLQPESVETTASAQGKSRVFTIRVAKHGNTIEECEDAVSVDPRRAVVAVADGASSSFGSHLWAAALTRHFVKAPPKPLSVASFAEWLAGARAGLAESAAPASEGDAANGWWSEHGAREGAYSTIVGAAIMTDGDARVATVMCLGDSSAFVLTGPAGERVVRRSLPYEDASQFGTHPALLGSMVDRGHDEPTWTTVPTTPGDLLVLASDAVAEWLLAEPGRFQMFDGSEPDAIASRLVSERTEGRIVNDDLTLAVLELTP